MPNISLTVSRAREEDFQDLLLFAVSTMMRRDEIVNLEWSDLDFERRLVKVCSRDNFTVKGLRPRAAPVSNAVYDLLSKRKKENGLSLSRHTASD